MQQVALGSLFIKSFFQNELLRNVKSDSRHIMAHLSGKEGYLQFTLRISVAYRIYWFSLLAMEIHSQWKEGSLRSTEFMPSSPDFKGLSLSSTSLNVSLSSLKDLCFLLGYEMRKNFEEIYGKASYATTGTSCGSSETVLSLVRQANVSSKPAILTDYYQD